MDANMWLRCVQWCDADVKPVATMPTVTSHIASSLHSVAQQQQQQQQQSTVIRPMNGLTDDDVLQPRHPAAYGQSL